MSCGAEPRFQRWDRTLSLPRNAAATPKPYPGTTKTLGPYPTESPSSRTPAESQRAQKQAVKASKAAAAAAAASTVTTGGFGGLTRTVSGVVKRRKHVVLLGLDGSGKTTILMALKYGCQISTVPTIGFNHEKVWGGGFRWSAWDVGGGEKLRPLWVMYARATDGIVFVVDASAGNDLVEEARVELSRVVKASKVSSQTLNVSPPPVLVLANFQDRSYARTPEEMALVLGLSEQWASGVMWAVAPVCGLTGEGLDSALQTLRALIDGTRKDRKRGNKETQTTTKGPPRWRW